jgi:hypothetical protein
MAQLVGHPMAVVGDTSAIHDSALNPVGTVAYDASGNEYIYLKGVASVVAGSWVAYDENNATALLDTDVAATLVGPLAVAMAAVVADKYGWFARVHKGVSSVAGTVADGGKVFPTATAGSCDDTGTAGQQILGAVYRSADSGGAATVQIDRPWIGANVA